MEWLHCNNCYFLPGTGKRFFLTSCGHIYCIDCKQHCCNNNVCKLCGNQCNAIQLSSQMKPDVEMYFIDPMELLKKSLTQVQQVSEFQNNHRAHLMGYYKKQVAKQEDLKEEFRKLIKTTKECDEERQRLSREIQYLKQLLNNSQYGISKNHAGGTISYISPHQAHCVQGYSSLVTNIQQGSVPLQRNIPRLNDFFSPPDANMSNSSYPPRVSVRTPPVNGKMGSVTRITPTSAIGNLRLSSQHDESKVTPINTLRRLSNHSTHVAPRSSGSVGSHHSSFQGGVSPAYFTPESQISHTHVSECSKNSAGSGIKKIKVQTKARGLGDIQKITVHPYSPCNDTPPNS